MIVLIFIVGFIGFLYVLVSSFFIYGFIRTKSYNNKNSQYSKNRIPIISVLVPFRNEAENLPTILKQLTKQTLSKNLFEVYFIDDNSTDDSVKIICDFIKDTDSFNFIKQNSYEKGKKNAIKKGVNVSNGDLIVTTDADCIPKETWLETILDFYLDYKPKLIIGPVFINSNNCFENLQSLEFSGLMGATIGSAGISHPIMCNGANLAYEKEMFFETKDILNIKEVSGDDMFLLHKVKKKYPDKIQYLKSKNAIVFTKAEKSFIPFLRQRIRWASKGKKYKDFDTIFAAILIFSINITILIFFCLGIIQQQYLMVGLLIFCLKYVVDIVLLAITLNFYNKKRLLLFSIPLAIIFPIYTTFTALISLFIKTVKWK